MIANNWSERYSVGHSQIDADHKRLFELCSGFQSAVAGGHGEDKIRLTMDELFSYAREHFAREEAYMREHDYDFYQAHKNMHQSLLSRLEELRQRYLDGNKMVALELTDLLTDWLINHIMKNDTKLAKFLEGRL